MCNRAKIEGTVSSTAPGILGDLSGYQLVRTQVPCVRVFAVSLIRPWRASLSPARLARVRSTTTIPVPVVLSCSTESAKGVHAAWVAGASSRHVRHVECIGCLSIEGPREL